MSEIRVKNPALLDRLRIQALLRSIADARGVDAMNRILQQAIEIEFRRQDSLVNKACSEPQDNS